MEEIKIINQSINQSQIYKETGNVNIKYYKCKEMTTLYTLLYSQIEWKNALGPTWGLGVGQSVNRAAQPLVGHTRTEFFRQVSQRLGSATSNSSQTSTNTIIVRGGCAR